MAQSLDHALCQEMESYVEQLTHSGQSTLDQETMKKFKKICKKSDEYVKQAFHLLMLELEKNHSEIRLSAFQMMSELFHRSHCFRELVLNDLQYLMELTIEINMDFPLPPPKPAAKNLKTETLQALQQWQEKFGDTYKKLSLGYNYLKNCKKVDFQDIRARTIADRRRSQEQNQRKNAFKQEKLNNTIKEMTDSKVDIQLLLTQIDNCLRLVLPDPESFSLPGLMSPDPHRGTNPLTAQAGLAGPCSSGQADSTKTSQVKEESSNLVKTADLRPPEVIDGGNHGNQGDAVAKGSTLPGSPTKDINPLICPLCGRQKQSPKKGTKVKRSRSKSENNAKLCPECGCIIPDDYGHAQDSLTVKSEHIDQNQDIIESSTQGVGHSKDIKAEVTSKGYVSPRTETTNSNGSCTMNNPTADTVPSARTRLDSFVSIKTEGSDEDEHFEEITDSETEEDEEDDPDTTGDDLVRGHGLGSKTYQLSIELVPGVVAIQETPDNSDILYNLKDLVGLLSKKFQPMVQRWLEVFAKTGADLHTVRKALDIKQALEMTKDKVSQLRISRGRKTSMEKQLADPDDDDSDDDDFEDVPEKEGYEPNIPDHLREEYGLVPKPPKSPTKKDWALPKVASKEEETDPTCSKATINKIVEKLKKDNPDRKPSESPPPFASFAVSSSSQDQDDSKLLKMAPVVPFGLDLFHWGEDKVEVPLLVRYDSEHRFWTPKDNDDVIDKVAVESMRSRVINYTGKFQPVKWACRAPLANGKLCPRRDRIKCPFHGKIIERNNMGQPVNPSDALQVIKDQEKKQQAALPDWEDPALQAEIKAATGVDLTQHKKGRGKGSKRKYPGLTDLKKKSNPGKNRLEGKIFNKGSIKRVSAAMDKIAAKRVRDKFGNNFHYTFPQ